MSPAAAVQLYRKKHLRVTMDVGVRHSGLSEAQLLDGGLPSLRRVAAG